MHSSSVAVFRLPSSVTAVLCWYCCDMVNSSSIAWLAHDREAAKPKKPSGVSTCGEANPVTANHGDQESYPSVFTYIHTAWRIDVGRTTANASGEHNVHDAGMSSEEEERWIRPKCGTMDRGATVRAGILSQTENKMEIPLVAAVDSSHWRWPLSTPLASLLEDRWINLGVANVFLSLKGSKKLPTLDIVAIIDIRVMGEASVRRGLRCSSAFSFGLVMWMLEFRGRCDGEKLMLFFAFLCWTAARCRQNWNGSEQFSERLQRTEASKSVVGMERTANSAMGDIVVGSCLTCRRYLPSRTHWPLLPPSTDSLMPGSREPVDFRCNVVYTTLDYPISNFIWQPLTALISTQTPKSHSNTDAFRTAEWLRDLIIRS